MNGREVFPDEELRRRIMDFIMAAGQTLLENGAEVFRVEQTMQIMARSFHLREFHVYILTNGIFASAGTAEISEVRNVPVRTTHLGRVAAVNALSREIAEGSITLDEAESRLVLARRIPFPKDWVQLVSGMGGAFSFAMIFGGDLRSALAAAVAEFIAGLKGLKTCKTGGDAHKCVIWGAVVAGITVVSSVMNVAGGGSVDAMSILLSLVVPGLYAGNAQKACDTGQRTADNH